MRKRRWAILLLVCVLALGMSGCGKIAAEKAEKYVVTFYLNYYTTERAPEAQSVAKGSYAEEPAGVGRSGYELIGWAEDEDGMRLWDFGKDKITGRTKLYAQWQPIIRGEITDPGNDKDLGGLSAASQEAAYDYDMFFLPEKDGSSQPHVGDLMPYYENGTFYMYYLKDEGDSLRHSIYRAETNDLLRYREVQDCVLKSSESSSAQDYWIGTGSVAKAGDDYYLFYTGHNDNINATGYKETIMLAVSEGDMDHFVKVPGFEIRPDDSFGQRNDFRDPQAYYDEENGEFVLTVTTAKASVARVAKYTVSRDLSRVEFGGLIYSDSNGFFNLECTDLFRMGDYWYLTFSGQDDTLWYTYSQNRFGSFPKAKRLEGTLFYAPKHVDDGENFYMVGWARRGSPSSTSITSWAGNIVASKLVQGEDGALTLAPIDGLENYFTDRRALAFDGLNCRLDATGGSKAVDLATCYESFLFQGDFRFTDAKGGDFGLKFDYNGNEDYAKHIRLRPAAGKVQLTLSGGEADAIAPRGKNVETAAELIPGRDYSFTYVQEGSVGVFYLDGGAALTVRLYGCSGKSFQLFAENNNVRFSGLRLYTRGSATA